MELRNRRKKKQGDRNPGKHEITIRDRVMDRTYLLTEREAVLIRKLLPKKNKRQSCETAGKTSGYLAFLLSAKFRLA